LNESEGQERQEYEWCWFRVWGGDGAKVFGEEEERTHNEGRTGGVYIINILVARSYEQPLDGFSSLQFLMPLSPNSEEPQKAYDDIRNRNVNKASSQLPAAMAHHNLSSQMTQVGLEAAR
jgi:hypothetical protein